MTADLVIRARRAVADDPSGTPVQRPAAVVVRAGRVVGVEAFDADISSAQSLDLADDEVLLPGLVDTHVHVNEPGRTEWEGFATATRAAAAGGVTTILDMPLNSVPPTVDVAALEVKRSVAEGQCAVDVGFWGGAIPGNGPDLEPLLAAGAFGVKCFLPDSGVPEFPPLDPTGLAEALTRLVGVDGIVLVHAEDPALIAAAPECAGRSYAGFLASRPSEAEDGAITAVVEAARITGGRAHIVHLSSASAVPILAAAKADGVRVTAETCPHYLTLAAEDVPDGATPYKCCPPVREASNRDVLWQALGDGVIDMVVSDHSPCTPELKRLDDGDFGVAWGGIASVQLGLPVVWSEARRRGHSLADVVGWMAAAPARFASLHRKGGIRVGADADFAAFAPEEEFVVEPEKLRHRHAVTPYAGRTLTGVVRQTWLRGVRIDADGPARGRLLSRSAA